MANFLDANGLLYLKTKIENLLFGKVDKVDGKGLSTNDYTSDEKLKLQGIESGANKTVINNTLTSTSTSEALAANQGKVLNDKITALSQTIGDAGYGDMLKTTYDSNGNGVVDNAEKLGGNLPSYYAAKTDIPTVTNDLTDALRANYDAAYQYSLADHAPATAQENVIEAINVNGSAVTVTEKTVNITIPTTIASMSDAGNYALKTDLPNVYKYKGSVATYADLSTGAAGGDVYNVEADGMNYAWDSENAKWDNLGSIFEIAAITNAEIDTIFAS